MLGLSLGELVVILAAGVWAFGPNELPRVARAAGRVTGQAAGFLYRTRAKFFKFAEETEMNKLHEEMQATMYQLNAIRSELQGGINIFQPGPLMQRVLSVRPAPGGMQHEAGPAAPPQQQFYQQQPGAAGLQTAPVMQQQQAAAAADAGSWAASAILAAEREQQVQRLQQLGAAQEAAASRQQLEHQAAGVLPQPSSGSAAGQGSQGEGDLVHPLTMPVSAVAAGLAPDRSGMTPTGSEVLLDALAEELIAAQVLRFRQQQMAAQVQAAAAQRRGQAAGQGQQQQERQEGEGSTSQQPEATLSETPPPARKHS